MSDFATAEFTDVAASATNYTAGRGGRSINGMAVPGAVR